ncbi:MAG: PAS domain S-box protein [Sideroxydans sp.]|nr:PAS domain S-box protein [Sideroxydans sp.]
MSKNMINASTGEKSRGLSEAKVAPCAHECIPLTQETQCKIAGQVNSQKAYAGVLGAVSEHQSTEEKLRASEEKFRLIAEHSTDGIAYIRADGVFEYVSPSYVKQLGYGEDVELLRTPESLYEIIHPDDRDALYAKIYAAINDKKSELQYEYRVKHRDGRFIWREDGAKFIYGDAGQHTGTYVVSRDISERKLAQQELRIASTAFESVESIVITDADGHIVRVNQAFCDTTGYAAQDVVGKHVRLLRSGRHDDAFYVTMWNTVAQHGHWEGEVWERKKSGDVYPKWLSVKGISNADGIVENFVITGADLSAKKSAEETARHLALYDPLTELPNRLFLVSRLQQALHTSARSQKRGALLFVDLDNFKSLNDTLGHDVGDLLLRQAASRLLKCVREADTVARLSGDEFVLLLEGLSELAVQAVSQVEVIGNKILQALNQPYDLNGQACRSSASIGVALFDEYPQAVEDILRYADIAMYQAKKAGRGTLRFFDPKMQIAINERVSLEHELHQALLEQQFELHYQIQVDSAYRPIGAESLIRWRHPVRGLLGPNQFIGLAEDSGLIISIGTWVLEAACQQLKVWQQSSATSELVLAVNVSPKQFHQADFSSQVMGLVNRHGIDPNRLKLELTESMLVDDIDRVIATMTALRSVGIQFSLDDFGTGYSSLQYLKRLPIDQLKIDLSFVKNIQHDHNDRSIVQTIVSMAQSLNLEVIAEGVENEEQRQILLSKGCPNFQGYQFSKPIPIEQFDALLISMAEKFTSTLAEEVHSPTLDESLLRQRDHHLLSVLDNMPAMIGYWDKNLRNRFGNEAYASWFGISPTQMLGRHIAEVLGERLTRLNMPYITGALRGDRQVFERSILSPEGNVRHSLAEYLPDIVEGEVQGFFVQVTDISAVKKAEEDKRRSEEKFKALFESNQDALILINETGVVDCNQAALLMFGCDARSDFSRLLITQLVIEDVNSDSHSELLAEQRIASVHALGKVDFEAYAKRMDSGLVFPIRVRLSLVELESGQVIQFVLRDLSEHEQLIRSLEISKQVLDVTTEGYWLTDAQGYLLDANQAYADMSGYSLNELSGMHISELEAQEVSREEVHAHIEQIIAQGSAQFETLHRHRDGHTIPIEITTSYLRGSQQFAVFARDITQRKLAEATLRDSEEMLRGLFELSSLGIAMADMNGRFIEFNEAFRAICGYSTDELKGLDFWKLTPEKYADEEKRQMENLMRTGRLGPYEKEYIRKDGSLIPLRLNGMLLTKKDTQQFIWCIAEDIAQEKASQAELLTAKEVAEQANQAKSRFLAAISNELRTPMNGILGMTQMLKMTELTPEQRQYADLILDSGHTMMTLINNIVEYAQIESEVVELVEDEFDPLLIMKESAAVLMHVVRAKGLQLTMRWQGSDERIFWSDPVRLRQMLIKLIENAVKFTSYGEIWVVASEFMDEQNKSWLEFAVVDGAQGIPLEQQRNLYLSFSQMEASDAHIFEHEGIGLAAVARITKMMGGEIGVDSEPDMGSRFWFRIPALRPPVIAN